MPKHDCGVEHGRPGLPESGDIATFATPPFPTGRVHHDHPRLCRQRPRPLGHDSGRHPAIGAKGTSSSNTWRKDDNGRATKIYRAMPTGEHDERAYFVGTVRTGQLLLLDLLPGSAPHLAAVRRLARPSVRHAVGHLFRCRPVVEPVPADRRLKAGARDPGKKKCQSASLTGIFHVENLKAGPCGHAAHEQAWRIRPKPDVLRARTLGAGADSKLRAGSPAASCRPLRISE